MPSQTRFSAWKIIAVYSLVALFIGTPAIAEPPQERMVKIVFRLVAPSISPTSFAAKPKTLYQIGTHYQRVEESANPETGIHALVVSKNRDSWMVNLSTKTGQHLVDDEENFDVYAPVFNAPFPGFNFGSELKYMADLKVTPTDVRVGDRDLRQYKHTVGRMQVRLMITKDTGIPYASGLFDDGRLLQMVRYMEYKTNIAPDYTLFEKPLGITYTEVDVESATQK